MSRLKSQYTTRSITLTAMSLMLTLGLGGCAETSASLSKAMQVASSFTDTLTSDDYAALAPSAGQVPLVTALNGLAPSGSTFAFANDVNINMPVTPADSSLGNDQRLLTTLSNAGLKARMTGSVIYIEHGAAPVAVVAPASTAPVVEAEHVLLAPAESNGSPQLMTATMMNAPVVAPGENLHQAPAHAPEPAPVVPTPTVSAPLVSTPVVTEAVVEPSSAHVMPLAEERIDATLPAATSPTSEHVPEPVVEAPHVLVAPSAPAVVPTPVPEQPVLLATTKPMMLAPATDTPPPPVAEVVPMSETTNVVAAPAPAAVQEPVPVLEAPVVAEAPKPVDPVVAAATNVNDKASLSTSTGVASDVTAMPDPAVAGSWQAERGQTLRSVLDSWCNRANVQLVWSTDFDYPLAASISLNDSFENAVRTLLTGFSAISPQPVARLHRQGNAGQRVLIVETRGNLYQDQ